MIFLAGMVPLDRTQTVVGSSIREQTRAALQNMEAALAAAGASLGDVCTVTTFLADAEHDFEGYDEVYREFFAESPPARATVGAVLEDILIEMQAIAVAPQDA